MTGPLNVRRHPKAAAVDKPWADPRLDEGLQEFNEGRHWHAHEAWEPLWMGLEGETKLFVQGLIMAAAMLHQYGRGMERGVLSHWENVQVRLPPHAPEKWGIDVAGLLHQLAPFAKDAAANQPLRRDPKQVRIGRTGHPTQNR
jgi:hypothetical protein